MRSGRDDGITVGVADPVSATTLGTRVRPATRGGPTTLPMLSRAITTTSRGELLSQTHVTGHLSPMHAR